MIKVKPYLCAEQLIVSVSDLVCGASYHTRAALSYDRLHKQTQFDTISCSTHSRGFPITSVESCTQYQIRHISLFCLICIITWHELPTMHRFTISASELGDGDAEERGEGLLRRDEAVRTQPYG